MCFAQWGKIKKWIQQFYCTTWIWKCLNSIIAVIPIPHVCAVHAHENIPIHTHKKIHTLIYLLLLPIFICIFSFGPLCNGILTEPETNLGSSTELFYIGISGSRTELFDSWRSIRQKRFYCIYLRRLMLMFYRCWIHIIIQFSISLNFNQISPPSPTRKFKQGL